MANVFDGAQIVDLAVRVEKNGAAFYDVASKVATSVEAKRVFDYLISEEKRHLALFHDMLRGLQLARPKEQYEGEWDAYLVAAAAEHVFSSDASAKSVIGRVSNQQDAIQLAIGFEKDSIILFHEIAELVSGKDKEVVEKLMNEEKDHLRRLSELRKILAA